MRDTVTIALCGISSTEMRMIELVLKANRNKVSVFEVANDNSTSVNFAVVDVESNLGLPQFARWRARFPQIIPISVSDTGFGGPGPLRIVHRDLLRNLPHLLEKAVSQWLNGTRILPEIAPLIDPTTRAYASPKSLPPISNRSPQVPAHVPAGSENTKTPLALIVHSKQQRRREVALLLMAQGYKCWQVESRSEASAAMAEKLFDLIIISGDLPDGDGYSLCHDWKSKQSLQSIPIVLIAKTNSPFEKARASYARCDYVVVEPASDKQWQTIIENFALGSRVDHAQKSINNALARAKNMTFSST